MDEYLKNIPDEASLYGLNKLLTTRTLTIDYKHRDTQMLLRDKSYESYENMIELMQFRNRQLRAIYNISRNIFKDESPSSLVETNWFRNYKSFQEVAAKTYVDFRSIVSDNFDMKNILDLDKCIVYSTHASEKDMIRYFVSKELDIPSMFRNINCISDVLEPDNINLVLIDQETTIEEHKLWMYNSHIFKVYNHAISRISFNTNEKV